MSDKLQPPNFQGEIMGVVLAGLIRSFKNIYVISGQSADRLAARIKPTEWYPVKRFYELLEGFCSCPQVPSRRTRLSRLGGTT